MWEVREMENWETGSRWVMISARISVGRERRVLLVDDDIVVCVCVLIPSCIS